MQTEWLRWATLKGEWLSTSRELQLQAQQRADEAEQQVKELSTLLEKYRKQYGDWGQV